MRRSSRTRRSSANAGLFATLATFPDRPKDLEAELTAFARRLAANCMCDRRAAALQKLVETEGHRYPELFEAWRERGPGRVWSAVSARLSRLAHDGLLDLDDPDLAARQLISLVNMDLRRFSDDGPEADRGRGRDRDPRRGAHISPRLWAKGSRLAANRRGFDLLASTRRGARSIGNDGLQDRSKAHDGDRHAVAGGTPRPHHRRDPGRDRHRRGDDRAAGARLL